MSNVSAGKAPDLSPGEHRFELLIGTLLRVGVLLSAAVVLLGGIIYLVHNGSTAPTVRVFAGEPATLRTIHGIVASAITFDGRGIIALGLLLLVATPVARVAFTLITFVHQKDWTFVVITAIVLAALLSTLGPLL